MYFGGVRGVNVHVLSEAYNKIAGFPDLRGPGGADMKVDGDIVQFTIGATTYPLISEANSEYAGYAFALDAEDIRTTVLELFKYVNSDSTSAWKVKVAEPSNSDSTKESIDKAQRAEAQTALNAIQAQIETNEDAKDGDALKKAFGDLSRSTILPDPSDRHYQAAVDYWTTFTKLVIATQTPTKESQKGAGLAQALFLVTNNKDAKQISDIQVSSVKYMGEKAGGPSGMIVNVTLSLIALLSRIGGLGAVLNNAYDRILVNMAENPQYAFKEIQGEEGGEAPSSPSKSEEPKQPDAQKTREIIASKLDGVLVDMPKKDDEENPEGFFGSIIKAGKDLVKGGVVEVSNFDEDGPAYNALKKINDEIKSGKPADIPDDIKNLPGFKDDNRAVQAANDQVLQGLQDKFPEELQEFIEENPTVGDLLKIGSTKPESLTKENKITYDNLRKYAKMLGVEREFDEIAKTGNFTRSGRGSGGAETSTGDDPSSSSGGSDPDGGRRSGEASGRSGKKGAGTADTSVKGTELLAIRFTIDGTYKGSVEDKEAATVKYKFFSEKGGSSNTLTTKFDKVPSRTLAITWDEQYRNFDQISISVTAYPAGIDGEAEDEDTISAVYSIPEGGVPRGSIKVFNFSQKVSSEGRNSGGIKATGGGVSVQEKPDRSDDVVDYYYDSAGRARVRLQVKSQCVKDNKKYTFTFIPNKPFIVPIITTTPFRPGGSDTYIFESKTASRILTEAATDTPTAVPHWIFLTKDMKGAGGKKGGAGSGGAAGGGSRKVGDPGPYNVAVSMISCETNERWAEVPQSATAWNRRTLEISLAPKTGFKLSGAAPILFEGSIDTDEIMTQVTEFILGNSEIWNMSGLDAWIEHKSVTGSQGITARRWTVSRAARPG